MDKRHLPEYLALAFVIVVLASFGYTLFSSQPMAVPQEPAQAILHPKTSGAPLLRNVEDYTDTQYSTIKVEYPQFEGGAQKLNSEILAVVQKARTEHDQSAEENWRARVATADPKNPVPATPPADEKMSFIVRWEPVRLSADRISLVLRISDYAGGAHGSETIHTFNYDLKADRDLTLSDFFPNDPNYVKTVSDRAVAALSEQFSADLNGKLDENLKQSIADGAGPKLENFATFTADRDNITFYFQEYQVGPYVMGSPTVVMPLPTTASTTL